MLDGVVINNLLILVKLISEITTSGAIEKTLLCILYISSLVISKMFSLPKKNPAEAGF